MWIIITLTFVVLLVAVLIIVLLPNKKSDTFPNNQNIIIKNNSNTNFLNLICVDTSGNVDNLTTDLSSNAIFIYGPVSDTLLFIANYNDQFINTIMAKLDNTVKIFNFISMSGVTDINSFSFTNTNLTAQNKTSSSSILYTGIIHTPTISSTPIKDGDTFPSSCVLYNITNLSSVDIGIMNNKFQPYIENITISSNSYSNMINLSSISISDFILIKMSANPIFSALLIYNQNGKIRIINIGQPKPLILLYNSLN